MQLSASERDGEDTRAGDALSSSKPTLFLTTDRERFHETTARKRPPGKPTGVTVVPYQTGRNARLTLEISWTANPNGNKAITNHEIEWSPNGSAGSWKDLRTVAGGLTETLFTGLSPGTTRHIRIRSQDADGWGPWSDVVSGTTNAVSAPGRPTGLTTTVSPSTIGLSWTAGDDGGSPITEYQVEGFKDGDQTFTVVISATLKPDVTSYTATGLTASTRYNIQVRARNSEGIGRFAAGAQVTTSAATTPGRPLGLTATVAGPSTVNLSWMPPVETGGSPITEYQVEGFKDGDQTFTVVISATLKPDVTSYTATGLTASTRYNIQVRARNSEGIGRFAAATQATTAALTAPAAPTGLTATAMGPTKIKLTWTAPSDNGGAAITGYKIEARTGTLADWADLVTDTKNTKTDTTHTGLTPSTPWFYRVSAINSEGPGTASNVATATTGATTPPSAPTGLNATASGRTTINLTWMAPTNTGGLRIRGYELQFSEDKTPRVWIQLGGGQHHTNELRAYGSFGGDQIPLSSAGLQHPWFQRLDELCQCDHRRSHSSGCSQQCHGHGRRANGDQSEMDAPGR